MIRIMPKNKCKSSVNANVFHLGWCFFAYIFAYIFNLLGVGVTLVAHEEGNCCD